MINSIKSEQTKAIPPGGPYKVHRSQIQRPYAPDRFFLQGLQSRGSIASRRANMQGQLDKISPFRGLMNRSKKIGIFQKKTCETSKIRDNISVKVTMSNLEFLLNYFVSVRVAMSARLARLIVTPHNTALTEIF